MMAILISWKRLPIFILYKNDRHLGINILQDGGYVFAVVNLMYISLSLHATLNAKGYTQKIEQNQSFVQFRGSEEIHELQKPCSDPVLLNDLFLDYFMRSYESLPAVRQRTWSRM